MLNILFTLALIQFACAAENASTTPPAAQPVNKTSATLVDQPVNATADHLTVQPTSLQVITVKSKNLFFHRFSLFGSLRNLAERMANEISIRGVRRETRRPKYAANCAKAVARSRKSGIYTIQIDENDPFQALCDGGGWTVIQRRIDGSICFYRNYSEYQAGFGNLSSNFWIGLDNLHALTTSMPHELLVILEDYDNITAKATYTEFVVGNKEEGYVLRKVGYFNGVLAGDSLTQHVGSQFSTFDHDNDKLSTGNCAERYKGGWWYNSCYDSNINGIYGKGQGVSGVAWNTFRNHYSLKSAEMWIRPSRQYKITEE